MTDVMFASAPATLDGSVRACTTCLAVYRMDYERCPLDGDDVVLHLGDPLLGETLGNKYVIEALVGEGAMSRVYRARHKSIENRRYAVKVLLGDLAVSATMRARFAREAENASQLDHPNVVNVTDFGKSETGLHYLVMDYVEGVTLTTIIKQGPMPAERVTRIAHQLCEGLEHAHGRGVIHRDFKCDNILIVGEPGRELARIADFGLAWSKSTANARLTSSGVACTPAFAAPEQLRGTGFDHRVDLYALGVVLFEMLSGGYLPFEGDIDQTVKAKLSREAPSIMTRAPNVPPGLVTLVGRLLASDPNDRPRSARGVIRALETSMTLPRPPIRTVEMRPLPKPRRRSGLATTVSLLLACGFGALVHHEELDGAVSIAYAAPEPAPAQVIPPMSTPLAQGNPPPREPAPLLVAQPAEAKPVAKAAAKQAARRFVRVMRAAEAVDESSDEDESIEPVESNDDSDSATQPAPIQAVPAAAPAPPPQPAPSEPAPPATEAAPVTPVPAAAKHVIELR